jgi:hypothetical protein
MSRRTRERRRHARSLNAAMLEVAAEDLMASPCVVCGQPAAFVSVWIPTAECIARDLDGDPAKWRSLVYRLCDSCGRRGVHDKQFVTTVENKILKLRRAGKVHRFKDGVSVPS